MEETMKQCPRCKKGYLVTDDAKQCAYCDRQDTTDTARRRQLFEDLNWLKQQNYLQGVDVTMAGLEWSIQPTSEPEAER